MQIKADVQSALICINLRFSFYINELFYGKTMIKYLVVGLGNIGPEYHETRHNIGFMTVEALARINNAPPFMDGRYGFTTSFSIKGRQLILLKPSTFMNLSGLAVRYWMQKENIPLENVLIVVDDLALPFGTLRLKGKGSDAGHNGLKHIAATLGTQNYARLRFGIGSDFPRGGQIDYVLVSEMTSPKADRLIMYSDTLLTKIARQWMKDWRWQGKLSKVSVLPVSISQ